MQRHSIPIKTKFKHKSGISQYEIYSIIAITISIFFLFHSSSLISSLFGIIAIIFALIQRKTAWTRTAKTCLVLALIIIGLDVLIYLIALVIQGFNALFN